MSRHRNAALVKLPGAIKWLKEVLLVEDGGPEASAAADGDAAETEEAAAPPKMVIFAHHKDVMDSIANQVLHRLPRVPARGAAAHVGLPGRGPAGDETRDENENENANERARLVEGFVRLEGATPPAERGEAVDRFRDDPGCRVALVSVTAGGVGVDLSASSSVVFAELPPDASMVEQAEDRVHRRGVKNAVNVYFLLAHGGARRRSRAETLGLDRAPAEPRATRGERRGRRGRARARAGRRGRGVSARLGEAGTRGSRRREGDGLPKSGLGLHRPPARRFAKKRRRGRRVSRRFRRARGIGSVAGSDDDDLWFELSANTGRLHLHARADGAEPLGQSVAPNDLRRAAAAVRRAAKKSDVFETSAAANDEALCARLRGDVGAILAAATFADELDALTARDRNALARHPARSPVAETLRALRGDAAGVSACVQEKSTTRHGFGRRRAPAGRGVAPRAGTGPPPQ